MFNNPETPVGPGDTVLIPPGCRQRITNTGSVDLIFLAICSPRFRPENYEDVGYGIRDAGCGMRDT